MNDLIQDIKKLRLSVICKNNIDILEIGLGMKMFSTKEIISNYNLKSHTILESNKKIYDKHKDFCKKNNINLVLTRWENFESDKKFDGIFYDLDYCSDIFLLKNFIKKYLKSNGIFTYYYNEDINPYNLEIEIIEKRLKYKDPRNRIQPIDRPYQVPIFSK